MVIPLPGNNLCLPNSRLIVISNIDKHAFLSSHHEQSEASTADNKLDHLIPPYIIPSSDKGIQ